MKLRIIEVVWIDSCASNHNWLMMEDIKNWPDVEPLSIHTFGIKVQEDDNYIVIAQNYAFDPEQCCNLMSIPKGCIKKIYVLEETVTSEAPEKIWIDPATDLPKLSGHIDKDSVEYTRTDAFIEKACSWLNDNASNYWGTEFIDSSAMVEDFKKYMKGE